MIVKQSTQQNLKEIMRLTLINILNGRGIIYKHYKNRKKKNDRTNRRTL